MVQNEESLQEWTVYWKEGVDGQARASGASLDPDLLLVVWQFSCPTLYLPDILS